MKKLSALLCLVLLTLAVCAPASAQSGCKPEQYPDGAPVIGEFKYDPVYAGFIMQKEQKALAYYRAKKAGNSALTKSLLSEFDSLNTKRSGFKVSSVNLLASAKRLSIYQVPQETGYYCGYAAIKSLLDYEGISKTQDDIADEVYNQDNACPWYLSNGDTRDQFPVPNYLTDEIGFYYVPYPYGAAGATNVTASDIKPKVVSTIDNNHGLVACGRSYGNISGHASILPGYPAREIGHWLAIDGYKTDGDETWIVDPAKSSAVTWSSSITAYYSITTEKLAAYVKARGIVW